MQVFVISVFIFTLTSCLGNPNHGSPIHVQDYFEQQCNPDYGFTTESFANWAGNLTNGTKLYLPLLSSLDILRTTQDIFQNNDLSFLTDVDVLNSCLTVTPSAADNGLRLTFTGYCGVTGSKVVSPISQKVYKWDEIYPSGVGGVVRLSMSDSKSWQIVDVCWSDNQRSFAVISLYPTLSPCTKKVITEHLKAIGFKENYFTELTYNKRKCSCDNKGIGGYKGYHNN